MTQLTRHQQPPLIAHAGCLLDLAAVKRSRGAIEASSARLPLLYTGPDGDASRVMTRAVREAARGPFGGTGSPGGLVATGWMKVKVWSTPSWTGRSGCMAEPRRVAGIDIGEDSVTLTNVNITSPLSIFGDTTARSLIFGRCHLASRSQGAQV